MMDQFFKVDVNTIFNGVFILFVWNWIKKLNSSSNAQTPNLVTLEMVSQLQTAISKIITKVAEINVWKDGHIENEVILHSALEKRIDRLEKVV